MFTAIYKNNAHSAFIESAFTAYKSADQMHLSHKKSNKLALKQKTFQKQEQTKAPYWLVLCPPGPSPWFYAPG